MRPNRPIERAPTVNAILNLAAVSLLFRRLKLPKGASLHSLRHTHTSHLLASGVPPRRCPRDWGMGRYARPRKFTRT